MPVKRSDVKDLKLAAAGKKRIDWADQHMPVVRGIRERFARDLMAQFNVTVLPGSYLARNAESGNPGSGRIRMALVAETEECAEAAQRIVAFVKHVMNPE